MWTWTGAAVDRFGACRTLRQVGEGWRGIGNGDVHQSNRTSPNAKASRCHGR
jgi:hypothetical protein